MEDKRKSKKNDIQSEENSFLKALRAVDTESGNRFYHGTKHADHNIPQHILLVETNNLCYSFNKNDIVNEVPLPNGKVFLEIREGSIAYRCTPFAVGKEKVTFQNITDHLVAEPSVSEKAISKAATKKDVVALLQQRPLARTLAAVAANWSDECTNGKTPPNNCAHYLSDAFIKAGFTELIRKNSEGKGIFKQWCDTITTPNTPNENARPIRALDMKKWFDQMAVNKATVKQQNSGFWAVYQERASDGQGHVLVYDSDNNIVYGVGGAGYWTWNQYFYKW